MKFRLLIFIPLIFFSLQVSAGDICLKWFQDSGAKPGRKECVADCNIIIKDMSTFDCANQCEKFCKSNECKIDEIWQKALNAPTPFKKFSNDEYNSVATALSRLPKTWRPQVLKAIIKANRPIDLTAILTPASSTEEQIILYKRAFTLSGGDLTRVLAHEVTHLLMEKEWSKLFLQYKKEFVWKEDKPRLGDFVEPDGKMSAEEDLANNIEYYIIDSSTLKEKSPKIHVWIEKNLKHNLELQKGCKYEK